MVDGVGGGDGGIGVSGGGGCGVSDGGSSGRCEGDGGGCGDGSGCCVGGVVIGGAGVQLCVVVKAWDGIASALWKLV